MHGFRSLHDIKIVEQDPYIVQWVPQSLWGLRHSHPIKYSHRWSHHPGGSGRHSAAAVCASWFAWAGAATGAWRNRSVMTPTCMATDPLDPWATGGGRTFASWGEGRGHYRSPWLAMSSASGSLVQNRAAAMKLYGASGPLLWEPLSSRGLRSPLYRAARLNWTPSALSEGN